MRKPMGGMGKRGSGLLAAAGICNLSINPVESIFSFPLLPILVNPVKLLLRFRGFWQWTG